MICKLIWKHSFCTFFERYENNPREFAWNRRLTNSWLIDWVIAINRLIVVNESVTVTCNSNVMTFSEPCTGEYGLTKKYVNGVDQTNFIMHACSHKIVIYCIFCSCSASFTSVIRSFLRRRKHGGLRHCASLLRYLFLNCLPSYAD